MSCVQNVRQRIAFVGMAWHSPGAGRCRSTVLSFRARETFCLRAARTDAPDTDRSTYFFSDFNTFFVSTVEFVCGLLLVIGALTPLDCALLGCVMIMAIATTAIRNIKASCALGWIAEFLYLPEVLYLVILIWLFFSGPGWLSVDQLILS